MSDDLRHSPLHEIHESLGASFTPFGAWTMPLKYGNELDEHRAVRQSVGLFDLSHMGEVRVTGPQAADFLDYSLISKLSALAIGRAKYSMMVNEKGGILDDLITYRLGEEEFLVVPNAANTAKVVAAFHERAEKFDVTVEDQSADIALIALQGPEALGILSTLVPEEDKDRVRDLKYYAAFITTVAGIPDTIVARTGYTGEDGFELYTPNATAVPLWNALTEAGGEKLRPCGLASRDSLRLEAAMPLYGNELSEELTPVDAGMGGIVSKKKEAPFIGDVLIGAEKPAKVLVGLTSSGKRAARAGATILSADETPIGAVTSGQPSPTLGHPIALGYVDREFAEPGTELIVDIRGKKYPFTVVETPFYKRAK